MSRRLVALVARVAGVGFATPAPAAADPSGDPGNVQTLTPPHPSQLDLDERFFDDLGLGVRVDLGVPDVTSHSFRKSVATMIDDAGLSAGIGADQLGHAKVSMTQDKYMRRGRSTPWLPICWTEP